MAINFITKSNVSVNLTVLLISTTHLMSWTIHQMQTIQILNTIVLSIIVSNWTTTFTWMTSIWRNQWNCISNSRTCCFYPRESTLNSQLFSKPRQLNLSQLAKCWNTLKLTNVLISIRLIYLMWSRSLNIKSLETIVSGFSIFHYSTPALVGNTKWL